MRLSAKRAERPKLSYQILDATKLDLPTLRSMWQFRLRFVSLKPHVPEEQDFAAFVTFFRKARTAVLARDAEGQIQMMLAMALRLDAVRRERVVNLEYTFFAPEHRREPRMYSVLLGLVAQNVSILPGWTTWCVGWAYPPSYVAARRIFPGLVFLRSPQISDAARDMLLRFGREVGGSSFHEETGLRDMPTIPRESFRVKPGRGISSQAGYEYLEANPQWAEGKALAVVAPLSIRTLSAVAYAVVRRAIGAITQANRITPSSTSPRRIVSASST